MKEFLIIVVVVCVVVSAFAIAEITSTKADYAGQVKLEQVKGENERALIYARSDVFKEQIILISIVSVLPCGLLNVFLIMLFLIFGRIEIKAPKNWSIE